MESKHPQDNFRRLELTIKVVRNSPDNRTDRKNKESTIGSTSAVTEENNKT